MWVLTCSYIKDFFYKGCIDDSAMKIGRVLTKSHRKHQKNRLVFCTEIYWRTTIEANDRWWGLSAHDDLVSGLSCSRIRSAMDLCCKPQRFVQNVCRHLFYRCISPFLSLRKQRTPGSKYGSQQCAIVHNAIETHDTWYRAGLFVLVTSHPTLWPTPNTAEEFNKCWSHVDLTFISQSFNF